jgi:hypothetical protein
MPPFAFLLTLAVMSGFGILSGGLLAYDPKLFVAIHRRIANSDYVSTEKWERGMTGPEARVGGVLICGVGILFAYVLLKFMRIV